MNYNKDFKLLEYVYVDAKFFESLYSLYRPYTDIEKILHQKELFLEKYFSNPPKQFPPNQCFLSIFAKRMTSQSQLDTLYFFGKNLGELRNDMTCIRLVWQKCGKDVKMCFCGTLQNNPANIAT